MPAVVVSSGHHRNGLRVAHDLAQRLDNHRQATAQPTDDLDDYRYATKISARTTSRRKFRRPLIAHTFAIGNSRSAEIRPPAGPPCRAPYRNCGAAAPALNRIVMVDRRRRACPGFGTGASPRREQDGQPSVGGPSVRSE